MRQFKARRLAHYSNDYDANVCSVLTRLVSAFHFRTVNTRIIRPNNMQCQCRTQDLAKREEGRHNLGYGGETPSRRRLRGSGGVAPAALFYRKRACSDAVTMDNAKIFPQLMSKSRGLPKISERRLQPSLV